MATPEEMAEGVLAVLAGSPLDQVAADLGIQAADLTDAIQTYQQARHAALETQAADRNWYQVHIEFPKWDGRMLPVGLRCDRRIGFLLPPTDLLRILLIGPNTARGCQVVSAEVQQAEPRSSLDRRQICAWAQTVVATPLILADFDSATVSPF